MFTPSNFINLKVYSQRGWLCWQVVSWKGPSYPEISQRCRVLTCRARPIFVGFPSWRRWSVDWNFTLFFNVCLRLFISFVHACMHSFILLRIHWDPSMSPSWPNLLVLILKGVLGRRRDGSGNTSSWKRLYPNLKEEQEWARQRGEHLHRIMCEDWGWGRV